MGDTSDAIGSIQHKSSPKQIVKETIVQYKMNRSPRGWALIFRHDNYDSYNLFEEFKGLGLEVKEHDDFTWAKIKKAIEDAAELDGDCLVITILTKSVSGKIRAKNASYELNDICELLIGEKPSKLAGKPKIIFVQASETPSKSIADTAPSSSKDAKIPTYADFLIAYSNIPDVYCDNDKSLKPSSYFVQELCAELHVNGKVLDLVTLLTLVNQRVVAITDSANLQYQCKTKKPDIPCVKLTSMLTALIRFN